MPTPLQLSARLRDSLSSGKLLNRIDLIAILIVWLCLPSGLTQAAQVGRETVSLNADWHFSRGDFSGAQSVEYDDKDWQLLSIPHDWAIKGPFQKDNPANKEGGFLPTGVSWYRRELSLPDVLQGKRIFVEFDGVMANSDVWINGVHLGHRPNGYVSFSYELTEHCKFGSGVKNVLAVRTDTSEQVASRWYTGSGIYRHVRLVVVDPVHVDYNGVFVTTPKIREKEAQVNVRCTIQNQNAQSCRLSLKNSLLNPDGERVAHQEKDVRVDVKSTTEATCDLIVPHPQLWQLDSPTLYTISTEIYVDGKKVDQVNTRFGIRDARFRSDTGFWLNGKNLKLKGVCLHHAAGAVGAAVPRGVWEYRLEKLRELGVNAIRTAHNPVAPEFLELCDEMGFLVMDEFFDCWTVAKRRKDYHRFFREWSQQDLRDTILRDRNHPSVVLYSVGNEIHDTRKEELAKSILKELVETCHRIDPTRPVTQGLFRPNVSHDYDNGLADFLDVIGTNYRDLELLQAWKDNPSRKIIGTEQGHERSTWLACRDHPQHAGQFLWVGIDYLGESWQWPITTFNAGLLDRTGKTQPRGYERQSWWSDEPMVHMFRRLGATEATPQDPGYEDVEWKRLQVLFDDWSPENLESHQEQVEVYSNCDEVELFLNGKSLGVKKTKSDLAALSWKVDFLPGELKAIARNSGENVAIHRMATADLPSRLELTANRDILSADAEDVSIIECRVVDREGNLVPRAENRIDFSVEGPGEIIAVDNGSIVSHESFKTTSRLAHQGSCIAILRANATNAPIIVTAKADDLEQGVIRINANKSHPIHAD